MSFLSEMYILCKSGVIYGLFAAIAAIFFTPLQYLKIQRQEFKDSYSQIISRTMRNGGIKIFFIGLTPYVILNFIVNGSFGIFDHISTLVINYINAALFLTILIRVVLGGCGETLGTIYFENKEIIRNKNTSNITRTDYLKLVSLICLRNSMAWTASVIIFEMESIYHFSVFYSIFLSVCLGMVFGMLSTPLDVLITRNSGNIKKESIVAQLKYILFETNYKETFAGGIIRFLAIGYYSAVTICTMLFMR